MAIDDSYTKSLLHFDGDDASSTFTDESGKEWTRAGTAQIDTAQSVFGGASGLFDGNSDYITTPDSADWYLDDGSNSNKWTIDFRVRFNGDPGTGEQGFLTQWASGTNRWNIRLSNNTLYFSVRTADTLVINVNNAWNPATATWYHVAIVKNGTSGYMMFVEGSQIGSTQTDTDTMANLSATLQVGRTIDSSSVSSYFNGWMDELRISKGIARWTSDFTPPSSAYGQTVVSNGYFWVI